MVRFLHDMVRFLTVWYASCTVQFVLYMVRSWYDPLIAWCGSVGFGNVVARLILVLHISSLSLTAKMS